MVGKIKQEQKTTSWKEVIISLLISAPIQSAIYFWFLQPANFISKRYIAVAVFLWILLAAVVYFFFPHIKKKIPSFKKQYLIITILLCIATAFFIGYFLVGLENIPFNLFTLPKHSIVIENASENNNKNVELLFIESGLGGESFSKLSIDGEWVRKESSLIIEGTKKASLQYDGWLVDKPTLGFLAHPDGGQVNVYWDGQLEQVSLNSPVPYERAITREISNPISNKIPALSSLILSFTILLFTLILLLEDQPISLIVSICFLLSYVLFFIVPIFLNSLHAMRFFDYVPAATHIGLDLESILENVRELHASTPENPYTENLPYPPFVYLFFTPLTFLSREIGYTFVTIINVLCYLFITLVFPVKVNRKKTIPTLIMLILVTGLMSFGFQFELERGQFDLITMLFCLFSIYIFHNHKKHRIWSYILFSISIQLKIFPAVFVFMFIEDWRDWKGNIIRFVSLGIANIFALFILGLHTFKYFINSLTTVAGNPFYSVKNHSIQSFINHSAEYRPLGIELQNLPRVELMILVFVFLCFGIILLNAFRRNYNGVNPYLLLGATLFALLFPSTSHDYTLSYFAAPVALLLTDKKFISLATEKIKPVFTQLLVFFAFAYSSTLFSYTNKPMSIQNNFPALMMMLIIVTLLSFFSNYESTKKHKKMSK